MSTALSTSSGEGNIFRAVVMDGDANVILLHKFFDARECRRGRVTRDDDLDARALAVFKLGADIVVFVFLKVDGPGGVQMNTRCGVVGQSFCFLVRRHGQMVLGVLGIQPGQVELLHECDQLRAGEIAERVAGQAQAHRRRRAAGF